MQYMHKLSHHENEAEPSQIQIFNNFELIIKFERLKPIGGQWSVSIVELMMFVML